MIVAIGLLILFIGAGLFSSYRLEDELLLSSKANTWQIYGWALAAVASIMAATSTFCYIVMRLFGWDVPETGYVGLILAATTVVSSLAYVLTLKKGVEELAVIFLVVGCLSSSILIAGVFL